MEFTELNLDSPDIFKLKNLEISDRSSEVENTLSKQSIDFEVTPIPPKPLLEGRNSETLASLISQNEDLSARANVYLRKLSEYEIENKQIKRQLSLLSEKAQIVEDQRMIWEEKEKAWNSTKKSLESELSMFRERFPDLIQLESKLEKYKKYQEKVKTTIKPYIQELKDFSNSLHQEIVNLQGELANRDSLIEKTNLSLADLRSELNEKSELMHQQMSKMSAQYERQIEKYQSEISNYKEIMLNLENRSDLLDLALQRQDELENLVVALRRSNEESELLANQTIDKNKLALEGLHRELLNFRIQAEASEKLIARLQAQVEQSASKVTELNENQAQNRYLLVEKIEECEKLRAANAALEKLNNELSRKLQSARSSENGFAAKL